MTIADANSALAEQVGTELGYPYYDYYPSQVPTGPTVISAPQEITYDRSARGGTTEVESILALVLGRESDRHAQRLAVDLIDPHGERSISQLVAADRTLNGHASGARVERVQVQSYASAGGTPVLFLAFTVRYYVGRPTTP